MKNYITIAALLAAGTAFANAEVTSLIDVNFTEVSKMPTEWTSGSWKGSQPPHFSFGNNGATVARAWNQNYLQTDLELSLEDGVSYTIEFTTYSANPEKDYQALFYLSSTNYSIALGNSYKDNADVYVGDLDSAIGDKFVSFQADAGGDGRKVIGKDRTLSGLDVSNGLTYSLTLTEGLLSYSITDGAITKEGSFTFSAPDSFSKIGFVFDGATGKVGVKDVSVVPEPSAFGLLAGLGALALVASRRRRK